MDAQLPGDCPNGEAPKLSLLHGLPPDPLSLRGFPAWRCRRLANSAAAVQCGAVGLDGVEGCQALLGVAAHAVDPTLKAGAISERTIGGTENSRARRRLLCGDRASPVLHEELTVQALMDLQLRSGVARPLLTRQQLQGTQMLSTANLRYRLRSIERLHSSDRPFVTLVLTHADQATRRAVRSLSDPSEHRRTFVATEGELLAGDHNGDVWQQCGNGLGDDPPVQVSPDVSLTGILTWTDRLLDSSYSFLRDNPKPNLGTLYPSGVQASMPKPSQQLASVLAVQLTRADKDALDLLAAWPLCTREQLAGLMGDVTSRRVNQVLRSLRQHSLVRKDESLLVLTDEGLTYLARRDRAAVGITLDRWSAEPSYSNPDVYAGTALRALASQLRHHDGVTGFVAALSAEVARTQDYDLFDLLPTSRSSIGYRYDWITYVILPDASFTLEYRGRWRPYLLEFERRATTPRRVAARLESYHRYFQSGWAERDHSGILPRVLFVFETPSNEDAFLYAADRLDGPPIITSNVATISFQLLGLASP